MKKQTYLISIIVLLILGFAFYWFSWRPTQIKKGCYNEARIGGVGSLGLSKYLQSEKIIESDYTNCLKKMGL